MEKLLSIIVPSYNMEKYLPKCLGSLVVDDADMLSRLDIIVVNDGSKDRTSEIAHEFETKYPGVFRVIDKANGNYGSCINAALPVAEGRFVKILDADDTYDTAAFGLYLKELANLPPTTDMVMNDWVLVKVGKKGVVCESKNYPLPTDVPFGIEMCVERKCEMAMHAIAYRTALVREIGYTQLEGISYTDTEWMYLPAAFSRGMRYIKQPVYRYLVGRAGQSVEHAISVRNVWMFDKIFDRMLKQYCAESRSQASRPYLEFQLQRMLAIALSLHLDASLRAQFSKYAEMVRQMVATHEFLESAVRAQTVFTRSPFCFHYVELIFRYPFLERIVLFFIDKYSSVRAKV